jgi:hypothetical protein
VNVDFVGDILAGSFTPLSTAVDYFFKFTTGERTIDGETYEPKLVMALTDLALSNVKRSASDSNVAYPDVRTMVIDYIYDYTYGHETDQWSSGCSEQKPMAF